MQDWLVPPEGPTYRPAPNLKGYLVNSGAVTLIAEARTTKGIQCVAMAGIGGRTILVIGTMEEVKRKLGYE